MLHPGQATDAATKAYADRCWQANPRLSPDGWRDLQGLTVAKVGLGTYRFDGDGQQAEAFQHALTHGINLIDTASNYMDGAAETFIGQQLAALFEAHTLQREEVVIISKAGYLQGQNLARWQATPPAEVVQLSDQLWHCIHPDFLHDQLEQSRRRLQLTTLDGMLLHNPEYFLEAAHHHQTPLPEARETFYQRLTAAFTYLEQACREGRLQFYGLSANTLGMPAEHPLHIDLAQVFEAAQAAAQAAWGRRKRPLFRLLQLPFNMLETGAVDCANTTAKTFNGTEPVTTLELATRMHLSVFANRPLNAFTESSPWRLADAPAEAPDLAAASAALAAQEAALTLWPVDTTGQPLTQLSAVATELAAQLQGGMHYDQIYQRLLRPNLTLLQAACDDAAQCQALTAAYTQVCAALRAQTAQQDAARLAPLRRQLMPALPPPWRTAPLQQIALNAVASTPGITSVLCGLRRPAYVADALAVLEAGDLADVGPLFQPPQQVAG